MENGKTIEPSGLAQIKFDGDSPFELFQSWRKDAINTDLVLPDALTFATCNGDGKVTARTVRLRRIEPDGFVIMTDRRSRKARDLAEVPSGAMVFLWCYVDDEGRTINRQVRVEGEVLELQPEQYQDLYDAEPLFCKIRSHICQQGKPVDWYEHKRHHDEVYDRVRNEGLELPMPPHFVAYKLVANVMDFYYAYDELIGDRLLFVLDPDTKKWKYNHVYA
ncbi:pyridoxine/pyridoxamine 5'-phosphate oxidase-like [Schistocerca gregaria]|uniref:pyridoxine/pyridoxamine 5'-phosphate oxidase-like n=1 Tax=Schistocerca gregaria TaxID=7010 RepID=UPI00211E79BA|nr:pyridoxine/pyridoxamine 5'-phosphate oxidase-like [Schistocerca gregaria]